MKVSFKLQDNGACNYFMWFDPPVPEQSKHVILGLLRRIREAEAERQKARTKEKMQRNFIVVLIIIIFVMFLGRKL